MNDKKLRESAQRENDALGILLCWLNGSHPTVIEADKLHVFDAAEKAGRELEAALADSAIADAPTDTAQPVAWRTRDRNVSNQCWTLWNQSWEPTHGELNLRYTYDASDLDAEVQPLYAHPEDAPGGPWTVKMAEGFPVCWSLFDEGGVIRTEFATESQANAVRDALNRFATKGETDG